MTLNPSNKTKHPSPAHCIVRSRRGEVHTKTLPPLTHVEKQRAASVCSGHHLIQLALFCVQVAFFLSFLSVVFRCLCILVMLRFSLSKVRRHVNISCVHFLRIIATHIIIISLHTRHTTVEYFIIRSVCRKCKNVENKCDTLPVEIEATLVYSGKWFEIHCFNLSKFIVSSLFILSRFGDTLHLLCKLKT